MPLSGAALSINGGSTHGSGTSGDDGSFKISLPAGIYTISVNKGGYQGGSSDVVVSENSSATVTVTLTEANLSNLQVIGRTSGTVTAGNPIKFDISSTPQGFVTSEQIESRPSLNLNALVTEIPGVVISHSANNPNTSFNIRGTSSETRTEIDGHPIGGSTDGVYYSLFSGSELFSGVDVSRAPASPARPRVTRALAPSTFARAISPRRTVRSSRSAAILIRARSTPRSSTRTFSTINSP